MNREICYYADIDRIQLLAPVKKKDFTLYYGMLHTALSVMVPVHACVLQEHNCAALLLCFVL